MNKLFLAAALSAGSTIAVASVVNFPALMPGSSSGKATARSDAPVYPAARNIPNAFNSGPNPTMADEWVIVRGHDTTRGSGLTAGNVMPAPVYPLQEADNPGSSPNEATISWNSSRSMVFDLTANMHGARAARGLGVENLIPGVDEARQGAFNLVADPQPSLNLTGVRTNTQPPTVSPVPEPESCIMMLAALGAITFLKRRER